VEKGGKVAETGQKDELFYTGKGRKRPEKAGKWSSNNIFPL